MTRSHLNPVLEITKPRSCEWTELVSCQKEAPFRNPPCSLPTNKNTTRTIHKRIFGALRLQATETSRQGRGPSGGAKIIVLCVFGCWFEASSTANNGDIKWKGGALVAQILSTWVPRKDFDGMERSQQVDWPKSSQVENVCVNEATKNSAPIASRRPLLCEGFHKTRHTSTCTRTKVHRRCLARSEIRDMTMCWKNLGECSKNYLPSVRIWFSYIWTDQKKISLLSLCKVYWVYLGVAYGCRTWRTSNAMKYTSKFHTSILLFLSWTHCVVISIQTEASQAVTGCRLPWATNPLVKRLLMLLSILSGDLDSSSHCLFDMHISWCCRFCWFTWCCHPWCRWIAFFWKNSRAPQTQYVHPPNGDPLWILDESWRIKWP